jgi:hypothetical protein
MAIGDPVTCIIGREKQIITNKGKDKHKMTIQNKHKTLGKT